MLPRKYRLKNRIAFLATYKIKNSFHKKGITVFCGRKKTEECTTKIGFVVSKKIHKRAVKRNRIKRLMRESLRLYVKSLNNEYKSKYLSLIFVASSNVLNKNFQEINSAMMDLIGLIEK